MAEKNTGATPVFGNLGDRPLTFREMMVLIIKLSIPSILAQISATVMQYIDAAMVGSLGTNATGAIGLVASTTWLFNGLCMAIATGFSVQVAQLIGAQRGGEAKNVLRQSLIVCLICGLLIGSAAVALSFPLPMWLGGEEGVLDGAHAYFFVFGAAIPFNLMRILTGNMLQCAGDMRTPSILNASMCGLDVIFNFFLIFPTRTVSLLGLEMTMPGAGMGVAGAALGTALSETVVAFIMLYIVCFRSSALRITRGGSWALTAPCLRTALRVAVPIAVERGILGAAQVTATRITAPLGTVAVAANSLAVTAESLCYMPGYGIGSAATTLVGQSMGANRKDLAKGFARASTWLGMGIMGAIAIVMFFAAPLMFAMLTPVPEIRELGTQVLRIVVPAEAFFGASIVAAGALRGAGDTVGPSLLNLVSMWGVRITLASILAPIMGLHGVWLAMTIELIARGTLFLIRLLRGKWLAKSLID
ncbi:MAG: MATE family efflux transporter [Oscillospiraceae bacterium]|nr:MATE family efflux transporter [Oscillospiraceae bacterium]